MAKILTIGAYIDTMSPLLQPVATKLATVIDAGLGTGGTIWHGHPVWMSAKIPVAGFKAHGGHVSFLLWNGQLITDRSDRLQASGSSNMTTLKLGEVDDIDANVFANWLHQVQQLQS